MKHFKQISIIACLIFIAFIACQPNDKPEKESVDRKKEEAKTIDVSRYSGNINIDGKMVVKEVSEALMGALSDAIAKHGTAGAVEFCNGAAFPILDSLAEFYGVGLKRTSKRYRNYDNRPDTLDKAILDNLAALGDQGVEPSPVSMKFSNGDGIYYAPIMTKPLCLQCHGLKSRGDIADDVWRKIRELYPEDVAYDYNLNELRGVWGVYFPAEYRARKGKAEMPDIPR
ncbi:MAG: DUF3365 domain-containing protein [Cryomorphaceae bacterium]|nr:DUF3365 domain-containing protein [Cryomorphaceae bacterium]